MMHVHLLFIILGVLIMHWVSVSWLSVFQRVLHKWKL